MILSARDAVQDRVKGLDLGADDYLSKPFSFEELLARVRSQLRRQSEVKETVLEYRGIKLAATVTLACLFVVGYQLLESYLIAARTTPTGTGTAPSPHRVASSLGVDRSMRS